VKKQEQRRLPGGGSNLLSALKINRNYLEKKEGRKFQVEG
jgi:hypothetical protein